MDAVREPITRLPAIRPGMSRKGRVRDSNKRDSVSEAVLNFCPKKMRAYVVAMAGEFIGTFMFLLFA